MSLMNFQKEVRENPVFPEGTYKVSITSYERCVAKSGTKQIRFKAAITEPKEHVGRSIIEHCALTDKALWKIANLINACGINTSKIPNLDTESGTFDKVLKSCVGRLSYWRLERGTDNKGNPRNDVVQYRADPDQQVIDANLDDDAPEFAKVEWEK